MKKMFRKVIAALEDIGCFGCKLDMQHTHPRIYFCHGPAQHFIVVSCTPKNKDDAVNLARQDARRLIGIEQTRRDTSRPDRPKRRHHAHAPEVLVRPEPLAEAPVDPVEPLTKHPHYPAVLAARSDAAFAALWRDVCKQQLGRPSVLSAYRSGMF